MPESQGAPLIHRITSGLTVKRCRTVGPQPASARADSRANPRTDAVVLLEQRAAGVSDYTFLDDNKAAKGFDKLVAAGYSYQGMMAGDLKCGYDEVVSQKLVFARDAASATRRYKILSLPEPKPGTRPAPALSELQRLAGEDFQIRDIFYAYGLHVILEKHTEARVSQAQPGAR